MANEIVKTEEKKPSIVVEGFEVIPKSFDEFYRFSSLLASSDFVPKDYKDKPQNVLVAVSMGAEIGLKPMQAIQNIAVINGRPSLWGDAMLAVIQNSGLLIDFKEWVDGNTSYCSMHRKGYKEATIRTFSDDDAKAAGLLNKQGPWTQYKNRMRQMRARGFCARDTFADVLKGFSSAEEIGDTIVLEPTSNNSYGPKDVTPQSYSQEQFDKNFPSWEKMIQSGKKSHQEIIGLIESKAKLSEEQQVKIKNIAIDVGGAQ